MPSIIVTENGTLDHDDLSKTVDEILKLLSKKGYSHHAAKIVLDQVESKLFDYCYVKV